MIELVLRQPLENLTVDATGLTPDRLVGFSEYEIAQQALFLGRQSCSVGDLYHVQLGPGDPDHLVFVGDHSRVDFLAAGQKSGYTRVEGSVGHYAGWQMAGGELDILGSAKDMVAAEMSDGMVRISGHAGDGVGGVTPGADRGMTGGVVLLAGDAGKWVGQRQRGGLIAIGGQVGAHLGYALKAGSIFTFGRVGPYPGQAMRRGTLALLGATAGALDLGPSYRFDCVYEPVFLSIYLKQLDAWNWPGAVPFVRSVARYAGDLLELARGEILLASG